MPDSVQKPDPDPNDAGETANPLLWVMLVFLLVSPWLVRLLPQDLQKEITALFR